MTHLYTIILDSSNELKTTVADKIVRGSKNVDSLHFLVYPTYKEIDMSDFTVTMEYISPVSKEYHTESLTLSEELYKDYLEYKLPFDTDLTKEAGDINVKLLFTKVEKVVEDDGEKIRQYSRHTLPTTIKILPSASWSDMIPDPALASLDQRLLKIDAMNQDLREIAEVYDNTKADDMILEDHILTLLSKKKKIGTSVDISQSSSGGGGEEKPSNIEVVEF